MSNTKSNIIWKKNATLLFLSSSLLTFAHTIFNITMMWTAYEQTSSALITATIASITHISSILGGPISGYFVDKYSPKKILQISYLIISIGLLTLTLFYYFNPQLLIYGLFLMLIIIDFTNTLIWPARNRLIPQLIPNEKLHSINGLSISFSQASSLLGNAISGFIIAIVGIVGSIIIDSIAFLIASCCVFLLSYIKPNQETTKKKDKTNFLESMKIGMQFIKNHPLIKRLIIMAFFLNAASFIYPLYIVLLKKTYNVGATGYGTFQALGVAGSIIGGLCIPIIKKRFNILSALGTSFTAICICTITIGQITNFTIALFLYFIMNFFTSIQSVFMNVFFMTAVPDNLRGKVMGTMISLCSLAIPIFVLLGGYMADIIEIKWMFLIAGLWSGIFSIYVFSSKPLKKALISTEEEQYQTQKVT